MYTKSQIIDLLETDDRAVAKAVWRIYQFQTESEQAVGATVEHNGVGFNAFDAEILTSFAQQVARGRTLSHKQMAIARKKMRKYAGQLAGIANQLERAKQEAAEMAAERRSWPSRTARGGQCCDQAGPLGCVCTAAFRCPVHGDTHIGTHD